VPDLEHRLWVITDAITDLIKAQAGPLGLKFVGAYNEKRVPRYPAAVVAPGNQAKTIAGIPKFDVEFSVDIFVYHADMTRTHAGRSKEDLELVEQVEAVLESDKQLGGLVIFGYVASQSPGLIQSRTSKTEIIVGTQLEWVGISRRIMGMT
jgi:hypothetical protein